MSITYINGKPFSYDALPVDHPKCCGECYLWCELVRIPEENRDDAMHVDERGHRACHEKFLDPTRLRVYDDIKLFDDLGLDARQSAIWLALSSRSSIRNCSYCNQHVSFDIVDEAVQATTACPSPGGVVMEYDIAFPSGRIVVDDDLRDVLDYEDHDPEAKDFASYNGAFGQRQVVLSNAKLGMAYGPVGNSCPSVYRGDGDHYTIANPEYTDDVDEAKVPSHWGEEVASVCTDLWAYSIMDYDKYIMLGGTTDMSWTRNIVEITPGTYHFVHHTGKREFDYDTSPIVYANFWRIGD